jgi:uncharacterized protein YkwD
VGKRIGLTIVLAALCAGFAAPVAVPAQHFTLSSLDAGVLSQLNHIRVQHGLVPLKLSTRLTDAAAEHSRQMGVDGYFEHTSADGTAFWKRIGHWYGTNGYGFWSVGENLLWSSPQVDPAGALKLWMNSPEHRKNILTARWREIGVSSLHLASAPGVYHGLEVTIITTDFGVRH